MSDIFYIVETKTSKCSCCGKTIRNVYYYNDKHYGYYCFMELIGKPVDKKILRKNHYLVGFLIS